MPVQLDKLHKWYDDEVSGKNRQGAEILYWEDVKEGTEIPQVIEGPLSITDAAALCINVGAFAAGWPGLKKQLGRTIIDPETGLYTGGVDQRSGSGAAAGY